MPLKEHLVLHLQEMYTLEKDFQNYLCNKATSIHDQPLKNIVESQISYIDTELGKLQQCLTTVGAAPEANAQSPLVQALCVEDDLAMQKLQDAAPLDRDVHLAIMDTSFANTEIGNYQGVLTLARALHQQNVVKILEEAVTHEEDTLQSMQGILNDLIEISQQQQRAA